MKLLALCLVLIAVAHHVSAKPGPESTGKVQAGAYFDTLPSEENQQQWNTREERRAAKAAERAANRQQRLAEKAADRAVQRDANKAAKAAERASQREATRAAKAAERTSQREAQRALNAEARKAARKAAREAQRAARNNAKALLARSGNVLLDDAQCLAAIGQCSLLVHMEAEMKTTWERTTLRKELKAIYKQRKEDIKRLKEYVIQLIDNTLQNPTVDQLTSGLCDGVQNDQGINDAGPGDGSATSTATTADPWTRASSFDPWTKTSSAPADPWTRASSVDPWTQTSSTPAQRCSVSQWSAWSAPYGFGTQERVRVITQPGLVCPEAQLLREERNITSTTSKFESLDISVCVGDRSRTVFFQLILIVYVYDFLLLL